MKDVPHSFPQLFEIRVAEPGEPMAGHRFEQVVKPQSQKPH